MADFKVIETQEQLDAIIKERLQRDREAQAKKYDGYISPEEHMKALAEQEAKIKQLEDAAAETAKKLADKDAEIAKGETYRTDLEKTKIAIAAGLKIDYASRLRGDTPEEWKKDAETLAKDFAAAHVNAPLGSGEATNTGKMTNGQRFADWFGQQFNS